MTAWDWMILPLRRYARFNGRARPREYWMFWLFIVLSMIALSILETALGLAVTEQFVQTGPWSASAVYRTHGGPLTGLFALGIFIPHLAVMVRRLHDTDRRGWWLLLAFIPILGGLVLLVFLVMGGTRGPNRFGPDPVEVGEGPE